MASQDKTLDIIIPSRNEMFLKNTVDDILLKLEGDTRIIVVLDGQWPHEGLTQHERVTVVYLPKSIGQRAATNLGVKLSKAKYVAKVDAHVKFSQGFDRILMEDIQDDWIILPKMYNLHVFDWVCEKGHRRYQGPSGPCQEKGCGRPTKMDILWREKPSPETTAMRFDRDLKFQYWSEYKKKQKGDLVETMSILGAFFMLTRERYWDLNICDEGHGSWGQQGTEVACKGWLSGGKVIVDKRCWYAHMFRTQGGDFGFPYPISGNDVDRARKYSRKLWMGNTWPKAKRNLDWLIAKFNPPDWQTGSKGILYYTDGELDPKLAEKVRQQIAKAELPITSVSLKPLNFGKSIHLPLKRGALAMAQQILAGLEAMDCDIVFFAEHDIWYHQSHWDFLPPKKEVIYYNRNVWHLRVSDGFSVTYDAKRLSQLCAYRETLIEHYKKKVDRLMKEPYSPKIGHEPGTHNRPERIDDLTSDFWESAHPNIDIKHSQNFTKARWTPSEFRSQRNCRNWKEGYKIPGYGETKSFTQKLLR